MPFGSLRFLICLVFLSHKLFVHWVFVNCEEDVNFLLWWSKTNLLFEWKFMISLNYFDLCLIFLMRQRISILCNFHALNTSWLIILILFFYLFLWRWFNKSCWILLLSNHLWFFNHHFSLSHTLRLLQVMRFALLWILLIRLIWWLLGSEIRFFCIIHYLTLKLIRGRCVQFHSIFFILMLLTLFLLMSLLSILCCHF